QPGRRLNRPLRQSSQPVEIRARKILLRPKRGQRCDWIESLQVADAGASFIMIATHEDPSHLTRAGDDLIRIGPITDDVAKVPDHVACRKSRPAGIEGIDIRVNIANDEDA